MKKFAILPIAVLAFVAACENSPVAVSEELDNAGEIVITQGVQAPRPTPGGPVFSKLENTVLSLGGSSTTALSVNGNRCSSFPAQTVIVTYTVNGNQKSDASFKVNTTWDYNGTSFAGSDSTTVMVPAASNGNSRTFVVTISVTNSATTGSGNTSFLVAPFNLVTNTSDPAGQQLSIESSSSATVHVAFTDCTPTNTAPTLTIPSDITAEATSSSGAVVAFSVPVTDAEEIGLIASCIPASGSTFALGETTVNCEVTDNGGLKATGNFKVNVEDTTPAVFKSFPVDQTLVAADINGAVLNVASLGITVADWNNVSEPSTFSCDYVTGTKLLIGSTTTVSCTAEDAVGNKSAASTFDVVVTLDFAGVGFLSPLRMSAPISAHKLGSTVPHKFAAPKYADGTLATDLAQGLKLVVKKVGTGLAVDSDVVTEMATGSTAWRYDADSGHYIFNLSTKSLLSAGDYTTSVSYAGVPVVSTTFGIRK
ncbi:hypothetical protein BH23GEM6_BH23GEM6_20860 [soil metagenome]